MNRSDLLVHAGISKDEINGLWRFACPQNTGEGDHCGDCGLFVHGYRVVITPPELIGVL